ncbi:MAG: Fic family protein [bacterium]|nr:Fic family protein [bacterium]
MAKILRPPDRIELTKAIAVDPQRLIQVIDAGSPVDDKGRYLHWDEMRHRTPPGDFTLEEWWLGTANSRIAMARPLPLRDSKGEPFRFSNVDPVNEMVHHIDQYASGQIQSDDVITTVGSSDRYLVSSLIEEAITSSMLEGAATTRRKAKELLRTQRPPADHGERMILNNFNAMLKAEQLARATVPLTPDDILELHKVVTEGTLEDERDAGRLQEPGEERVVVIGGDFKALHQPPPAEQLPDRLEQLCAFANGELTEGFLHPVVRAILVHFWVGHDHPFVDGNGRTARALFYWSMLRSGYWLAQYLSISAILRKAPGQYVKSYLRSETGDNDATYFVIYQLEVIERAIDSLRAYLTRKTAEVAEVKRLLRGVSELNNRQLAVISDALHDPYRHFTIQGHAYMHRVVHQSGRSDLLKLESMGILEKSKMGKRYEFYAVDDLLDHLHALVASKRG